MSIDRIYINTHRYDLAFTRICIASIRYWYPSIPISLIVDYSNGSFHIGDMAQKWGVEVLDTQKRKYGWGFGKFEPLFLKGNERFLVLDADTVLTGKILEKLETSKADFVVDAEIQNNSEFEKLYYKIAEVEQLFADFKYPGYSFNTGQWVGRTGIISEKDFDQLIEWGVSPRLKHPTIFKQADQGLFNFILQRKQQRREICVDRMEMMLWPGEALKYPVSVREIRSRNSVNPFIIRWAGIKFNRSSAFPNLEIALFYEDYFFSKYSSLTRLIEKQRPEWYKLEKKLKSRFRRWFKK